MPSLQIGLAVADDVQSGIDDGATLGSDGTVAFRKKAFVTKRWGLEVSSMKSTTGVAWLHFGQLCVNAQHPSCKEMLEAHSRCNHMHMQLRQQACQKVTAAFQYIQTEADTTSLTSTKQPPPRPQATSATQKWRLLPNPVRAAASWQG